MKQRNINLKLFGPLILGAFILATGCKKDNDGNKAQNIAEVVASSPDFSILKAAVTRAGLSDFLSNTDDLTVFAPVNQAFIDAGLTESVINATDPAVVGSILSYHVLTSKIMAASVPAGPNAEVTTASSEKIYVTSNSNGVFVNGVSVTTADVAARNGVIHVIGRVLLPPSINGGNIVEVAQANSDFSYLVAAVLRASQGATNIAAILSGAGPFTVFAPTNQAFIDAGFATEADINAADPDVLANILLYHAIGARVFSSDLTEGATPTTAEGSAVTVTLTGGAKVTGGSNTAPANIVATDIMANNGVIHVIDKVLLP